MKTKIIYISGNEFFDMTDIKSAFDEVRNTLGLSNDTVLFGVPVDNDDVFATDQFTEMKEKQIIENSDITSQESLDHEITEVEPIEKKQKKSIKNKTYDLETERKEPAKRLKSEKKQIVEKENIPDTITPTKNVKEEKIIPILSILSAKKEESSENEENINSDSADADPDYLDNAINNTDTSSVTNDTVEDIEQDVQSVKEEKNEINAQVVTIEDMVTDEAPNEPIEKTLEQLLESMTPLREDVIEDQTSITEDQVEIEILDEHESDSSSDATLEQLATEFAENADKIQPEKKIENHSKIGKLKNILPFKKAKREDNGLMGDLFGWAGIAANDDDFSIPGFFTNTASKK